eukprot:TRINITY_DN566_c1_g1_i1.p1 TRINITY_DN566_c1_g1~~TRINITY_DN566_c1_g1_i1.p1  ORF type:complete len:257 (-),score=85.13 TRINITY_DN566_c1_g1_i1:12-716(-)
MKPTGQPQQRQQQQQAPPRGSAGAQQQQAPQQPRGMPMHQQQQHPQHHLQHQQQQLHQLQQQQQQQQQQQINAAWPLPGAPMPPRGGPMGPPPQFPPPGAMPLGRPPPPAIAPPSFFPGAASLHEQLDKVVMVVLRDGRHLVGLMRSYDQFSNIVLEDTHERHFVGALYGDIPLGLYIVRGDSVVLLGEVAAEEEQGEQEGGALLKRVTADDILQAQQESDVDPFKVEWDFGDQ